MRLAAALLGILCVLDVATPVALAQIRTKAPTAVLPRGSLGQAYSYQLGTPQQGTPPWRFRSVRGSLPPGITLDPTGVLAGTPTAPGQFHFTLEATDSSPTPVAKTRDYILTVPPPAVAHTRARSPAAVLPNGSLGQAYFYQLGTPQQGTPPWRFHIFRGSLPPGIALDPAGVLAGTPTAPGEFHFTLEATDSSPTPVGKTRDYVLTVPSPLTITWTKPPQVTPQQVPPNGDISGELEVTVATAGAFDLTVIVVAVNAVDKAFTLGYQHFSLGAGSQRISFGSIVPRDTYIVHADVVAEDSETGRIYRARLQTGSLAVP
jgi:putative Ig domain-containing protein